MKQKIAQLLRSPALTLGLLIAITAMAAVGTFFPKVQADAPVSPVLMFFARALGLADTFRSPAFLSLVALLALNIAFCTTRRFSLRRSAAKKRAAGKRRFLPWLDLAMHCSILVILAGGVVKGVWGFVGTAYFFVGYPVNTIYDWRIKQDVPLGFAVIVRERVEDYYPLRVRIGITDAASGEKLNLLELQEGEKARLAGGGFQLGIQEFDRTGGLLRLAVEGGGRREVLEVETTQGGNNSASFDPYRLTLVAWRQDVKRVRSRLVLLEGDKPVKEEWLETNGRVAYRGTSLFQTAWGFDEEGKSFTGIQVSRDPGAPVFWAGSVMFCLALPLFLYVRHSKSARP